MASIDTTSTGRSRPTHHRRRSSVNTRGESAELMGITLPELPVATSQENVNFNNSSFQRSLHEFSPVIKIVEIPTFDTDGIPERPILREPKLPTAFTTSSVPGKRNSFGKFPPSNSPKVQLQTLVEEEEEEEETVESVSSCEETMDLKPQQEDPEANSTPDVTSSPKRKAHHKAHRRSLSRDGFFAARWLTDIITTLPISSFQIHYQS